MDADDSFGTFITVAAFMFGGFVFIVCICSCIAIAKKRRKDAMFSSESLTSPMTFKLD